MNAWLYQMSTPRWYPEAYRLEVWEGEPLVWSVGSILPRGLGEISPGDSIVLFFSKSGNDYPGIYGWGIIYNFNKRRKEVKFRVTPPSNYLKSDPLWDKDIERLLDRIRGEMRQRTIWGVSREEFFILRKKIRSYRCM